MPQTDEARINFADVEEQKDFSVLPAGRYHVEVTGLTERAASDQSDNPGARILRWEFTVASGEYTGRKVWDNQVCVKSAFWKIKAMLQAGKVDTNLIDFDADEKEFYHDGSLYDMDDLVGVEMDVKVGVRPARKDPTTNREYQAQNRVNNFYEHEESEADLLP